MDNIYFKASINNTFIYVETTTDYISKLFDHFIDNGYKITELDQTTYYEALKDGGVVYYANTNEIVDNFIDNSNKIKEIRNGG